jgi:hypothetical protein
MVRTKQARLILLFVVLFAQGCASTREVPVPARDVLGTVNIVAIGEAPAPEALGPIGWREESAGGAGRGILYGAGGGAAVGFVAGLTCGPFVVFCAPAGALVGALSGGIAGGVTGAAIASATALPTETEAQIQTALAAALVGRNLPAELAERVRVHSGGAITAAATSGETRTEGSKPDYAGFASNGVNTVLEIGVTQIALTREDEGEASFALMINANAHLVRASDGETLWSAEQIVLVSAPEDLPAWLAPGSELLRTEISASLERLALRLSAQLFTAA